MREKRYIWLPLVLLCYFAFMTFKYGIDLLHRGETTTFVLTCVAECVVLILLALSLKRRDRLRREREQQTGRNN